MNRSGVYLLLGITEKDQEAVYIGQADVRKNERVCCIGYLNLIKVSIIGLRVSFLQQLIIHLVPPSLTTEYRLHEIALDADRCKITNGGSPHKGSLQEEKEDEMEDFIDFIRLVVRALGRKVFEPMVSRVPESSIEDQIFHSKGKKASALAKITDDGIVVLKGSQLAEGVTRSAPKQVIKLREKYKEFIDNAFALTKDVRFASPSAAAGLLEC